jgi:hypothetical protein
MGDQPVHDVMGILPDGLGDDERGIGVNASAKDLHAFLLATDKAMLLVFFVRVRADEVVTGPCYSRRQSSFHLRLSGPALLVGGQSQVAVGDELDLLLLELWRSVGIRSYVNI